MGDNTVAPTSKGSFVLFNIFPDEIKGNIIEQALGDDLPGTWLNFRRVSKWFKQETEAAFVRTLLKTLHISVYRHRGLQCEFVYDRVSADKTRAIFRVRDSDADNYECLYSDAHQRILIVDGQIANDTPLIGYQYDLMAQEVSFLWKPTIDVLIAEEVRLREPLEVMIEEQFQHFERGGAVQPGPGGERVMKKMLFHTVQAGRDYQDVVSLIRDDRVTRLALRGVHRPLPHTEATTIRQDEHAKIMLLRRRLFW
ncbi:hypothetical protein F4810DRAFT_177470 [Camillea tinctor]|nr:hypothetical protein F4810DRAFT_177470 [Camillea tinctor]